MDRVLGSCLPGMEMVDREEEGLDLSLSLQRSPLRFQAVFACCYCPRKFRSSQALGGHQNAHKLQRNLARRGWEAASLTPVPVAAVADQGNNKPGGSESAPAPRSTAAELVVDAWGEGRHRQYRHLYQGTAAGGASSPSLGARGTAGEVKEEMIDLSLKL